MFRPCLDVCYYGKGIFVTDHRYSTESPDDRLPLCTIAVSRIDLQESSHTCEKPRLHKFEAPVTRYDLDPIEISVLLTP